MPGKADVLKEKALADAMQRAWNDHVLDTRCHPECFITPGRGTIVADFTLGNYVYHTVSWLNANGYMIVKQEKKQNG